METAENSIYRKLQLHLDKYPIGYPATDSGVELEILRLFFTEDEAKIALSLSLVNSPLWRIYRRYKKLFGNTITKEEISHKLDQMFMKGVIRRSEKPPYKYGNAMLALGMFEFQVDNLTPELMNLLHQYFDEAFREEFFRSSIPQLRTSPHFKAIVPEHKIDTYDNMREYIQNTKDIIHVANCVCKQGEALLGKSCKVTDNIEICIQFGEGGYLDRGRSRVITKEEALKILDYAEERGLVIQPANSLQPFCICLCCGCCCGVLTNAKKFERPAELFATNYIAHLESELCIGCGLCVKRCQMDALVKSEGKVKLLPERCIGCGLCVTKCPKNALKLTKKSKNKKPPMNTEVLYMSILSSKVSKGKMILNLIKLGTGMRL